MPSFNIADSGAVRDGKTDKAAAIQRIIDECHASGGGRVIVPAGGVFVTGPFKLKSCVELNIEASATLRASLDESLYTETPFNNWSEGWMWISAKGAHHIAIMGTGTVDGRGTEFMDSEEPTHYKFVNGIDRRPHLLTLIGCNNVTICEVTFANAAYWCVHPAGCQDVLIQGVRILPSLKVRNCDGIDIDHCRNVRISNCYIESADDCICIKNRRDSTRFVSMDTGYSRAPKVAMQGFIRNMDSWSAMKASTQGANSSATPMKIPGSSSAGARPTGDRSTGLLRR